jgi:hypothetical protein
MSLTQAVKAVEVLTVSIPEGADAESTPFDTEGASSIQIITPSDWVASNIEMKVSADAKTWVPLVDSAGTEIVVGTAIAASKAVTLAAPAAASRYVRLISVTDQTATKTITVILKN